MSIFSRLLAVFGLFLLAVSPMAGQQSDSLIKADLVTLDVDRFGLDKQIDEGFKPFGDAIGDIIFYAPRVGQDVLIGKVGNPRPGRKFFQDLPFSVTYDKDSEVPFAKVFRVDGAPNNQLAVSYAQEKEVKLGQSMQVEGVSLLVERLDPDPTRPDQLRLRITYPARAADFIEGLQIRNVPVPKGTSNEAVEDFMINYRTRRIVSPGEQIDIDGFRFSIDPNKDSANNLWGEQAYTFRVEEVTFLPFVIIVLLLGATFFTLFYRFVNIRRFMLAINVVRGKYSDPSEEGEVSHFQALTAALSGTVGLGNIAGVAIAISVGGAGATFWMILAGLIGMSSKFVECTLGVKYRTVKANGVVSGGPMYYLSQGLGKMGMPGMGKVFAIFFSIMCIGGSFGGGNMFQINQAFKQFSGMPFVEGTWFAQNAWLFGLIMALLVGLVIIGGIRSIARITDKIVPFMCGVYVLAALVILVMYYDQVPRTFLEIFENAFAPTAIAGGFLGVLIQGFRRAAFSNEAGVGSASIAHSAVRTSYPASEGIVALLEPFIDTVVVCTMTALVIIITDNHLDTNVTDGVELTSRAFSSELPFFKYVLSVAVILFAFSTMITWSYYGLKAWTYMFGDNPWTDTIYKIIFCGFVVVGAAANMGSVTDFSDAMIFAMAFPNVIGMFLLRNEVRDEIKRYMKKIRKMDAERAGSTT